MQRPWWRTRWAGHWQPAIQGLKHWVFSWSRARPLFSHVWGHAGPHSSKMKPKSSGHPIAGNKKSMPHYLQLVETYCFLTKSFIKYIPNTNVLTFCNITHNRGVPMIFGGGGGVPRSAKEANKPKKRATELKPCTCAHQGSMFRPY